tara:strand:+ start:7 stop:348 length:342 start_codon:yes stop_codon:yes gene_type:complete
VSFSSSVSFFLPVALCFLLFSSCLQFAVILHCTTTGNRSITDNNFAAALGLPKELHREKPQAVYRHWRLREDQFLFLREKIPELRDASLAVLLWDEQHRLLIFRGCSFSPSSG